MHPYHSDQEIRIRVFIMSACLAVGTAYLFSLGIHSLPFAVPWWIETPSVLGFFGLFIWVFDNYLWKTKFFQQLDWFAIPNLNGEYETEIRSSHEGFDKPIYGRAIIRQTASRLSISVETDTSFSHTIHAALIRTDKIARFELSYTYINHPKADAITTMNIHQGTVLLQIDDNGQFLHGEYYSGRGRQSFGKIILKRA